MQTKSPCPALWRDVRKFNNKIAPFSEKLENGVQYVKIHMDNAMKELNEILRAHSRRYPLMRPTDAVKLIYQNEFGGGHLIQNEQACLDYLRREYAQIRKDFAIPLYEQIGNGIVRVNLAAVEPEKLEELGQAFLRSARSHTGDLPRFLQKLEILRQLTADGCFDFDCGELEAYLIEYQQAGYPPVSHSQQYRNAYHPAYRIVCR